MTVDVVAWDVDVARGRGCALRVRDAMEVMDVDGAARRPVELARLLLPCLRWVRAAGKNCLGVSQLVGKSRYGRRKADVGYVPRGRALQRAKMGHLENAGDKMIKTKRLAAGQKLQLLDAGNQS